MKYEDIKIGKWYKIVGYEVAVKVIEKNKDGTILYGIDDELGGYEYPENLEELPFKKE